MLRPTRLAAAWLPFLLLVLVFASFAGLVPGFASLATVGNLLVQASVLLVGATGVTLVLLAGRLDLSVGSSLFVAAVCAGKLFVGGASPGVALLAALGSGLVFGVINAFFVVHLRLVPFIVTLAMLYIGRGFGLYLTETRAMNLPDDVQAVGAARVLGIPLPVWVSLGIVLAAHVFLTCTAPGRQLYALGNDREIARKAGLPVARLDVFAFVACAVLASLAGFLAIAQVGVVSPTLGNQRELSLIAAAVLGGTSLFGGRGGVLPGTFTGALLVTTIEAGLNVLNVDPYLYPLVTAAIIFGAVAVDSLRDAEAARRALRRIRPLDLRARERSSA